MRPGVNGVPSWAWNFLFVIVAQLNIGRLAAHETEMMRQLARAVTAK